MITSDGNNTTKVCVWSLDCWENECGLYCARRARMDWLCFCVYVFVCVTMCVSVDVSLSLNPCVCMSTSVCNYPYVPASLCISLSLSLLVPVPLCLCLCVSMSVQMFVCCRFPTAWSVTWKVKCAQETDNKVQGMHWECWSCFQRQLKWLSWWLTARPLGRGVKHNGQFGWCAAFGNQPCHGNQIVCGPLILSRFQTSKFQFCTGQIVWPIFTGIYFGQLNTHGLRYSCNSLTLPTSSMVISFASCEACGKDTDSKTNK